MNFLTPQKIFRSFAPKLESIEGEFTALARKFENGYLYSYSAQCWQKSAYCQKLLKNELREMESYLNAARRYLKADREYEKTAPQGLNKNTWHDVG